MAKFVGFIGTIRGKVGTTVFSKGENGMSYGRAYQPQVLNPKTAGQTDQRAKMNLVGRMSQATPKALIVGMSGSNNRQRRSGFNRNLLDVATIDRSNPGSVIAKIDPENIIFSQGAEILRASAVTPVVTAQEISTKLTLTDASLAGAYGERLVAAIITPEDKAGYSKVFYADKVLDSTAETTVNIVLPGPMKDGTMVAVYRIPFVLTSEGANYRAERLVNDGTDIIAQLVATNGGMVRGFGDSSFTVKSVFTGA